MILFLLFSVIVLSSGVLSISGESVTSNLYGTVTLSCKFSFVKDLTDLTIIWKKEKLILYKVEREKELEQDPRYKGRVQLSKDFKQGNLDLTLRNVTYEDEGTYYCRASNNKGHGDKKVTLSIDDLDADKPTATLVTIDGKRRWKCRGSGDYHNPQVQWITAEKKDLSTYGRLNITDHSNGRNLVKSVLDYDVEEDAQVLCHIQEENLGGSAQVVKSELDADNPTVTLVTIDGKRRWKCRGSSNYHNPQVQWIIIGKKDLSSYGRLSVTDQSNGWKLVESVLDYDAEEYAQILCHINDRRQRRSARAIKSDGIHPIFFDEL